MSDIEVTTATRNGATVSESMENESEVVESTEVESVEARSPLEGTDISVTDVPAEMEASEAQHQIDASVGATEPEVAPEGYPEEPKQPELITVNEGKEQPFWGGFFGKP